MDPVKLFYILLQVFRDPFPPGMTDDGVIVDKQDIPLTIRQHRGKHWGNLEYQDNDDMFIDHFVWIESISLTLNNLDGSSYFDICHGGWKTSFTTTHIGDISP